MYNCVQSTLPDIENDSDAKELPYLCQAPTYVCIARLHWESPFSLKQLLSFNNRKGYRTLPNNAVLIFLNECKRNNRTRTVKG